MIIGSFPWTSINISTHADITSTFIIEYTFRVSELSRTRQTGLAASTFRRLEQQIGRAICLAYVEELGLEFDRYVATSTLQYRDILVLDVCRLIYSTPIV